MIVLCVLLLFLDHHLPNDCSSFSSAHISSGHLYCFSVNPAAPVIFCTSLLVLFDAKNFFSRLPTLCSRPHPLHVLSYYTSLPGRAV